MSDGKIGLGIQTDFDKASRDIDGFSKRATMSLASLSQVIQDLPYGFIGIQNNIPILTQQFSALVKEEKGVFNAFKAIGQSLISPTGLIFAVSSVTAGVDYLIQKYGSLGNAMNVIFSKNQLLASSNLEYKKSLEEGYGKIGGEIGKIDVLVGRINNLNLSNRDRYASYVELNKIAPDIQANIKKENDLTAETITFINNAAKARIEYLKLKVKENAITSVLDKTQGEVIKKETALGLAKRQLIKLESELRDVRKDPISRTRALREAQLTNEIEKQNIVVSDSRAELFKVYDIQNSYYKLLDPLAGKIANYDLANKELSQSLREQPKLIKDQAKAFIDLRDPIKRTGLVEGISILTKDTKLVLFDKIIDGTQHMVDVLMSVDLQQFINKFNAAQETVKSIFFDPFQQLFVNLVTNSKNAFKEFTKAILTSISQIVGKIIATKIVTLLADLFAPGSGALVRIGLKSASTGALGDFLGVGPGSANFGGVQGGAMGMTGSVNLTLRGSDLVGAINRTNSQISRVG